MCGLLRRRRGQGGYLVLLVSVLVSLLTVSFLRHAAGAAQARSEATMEEARVAALYAAESALTLAESRLPEAWEGLPPSGTWRAFRFEESRAAARVELSYDPIARDFITIKARSRVQRSGAVVQLSIEAVWQYDSESGWSCRGRRLE